MNEKEAFDWVAFGEALSNARREAGYRTTPAFKRAVESASGLDLSAITIRKIEKGQQQPRVSELMAFSLTLFGATNALEMDSLLQGCICEEWRGQNKKHLDSAIRKSVDEAKAEQVGSSLTLMRLNQAEEVYKNRLSLAQKAFESVALNDNSTQEQIEAALARFEEASKKILAQFEEAIQGV